MINDITGAMKENKDTSAVIIYFGGTVQLHSSFGFRVHAACYVVEMDAPLSF